MKNQAAGGLMMAVDHPSQHLRVVIRGAGDIATGVARGSGMPDLR